MEEKKIRIKDLCPEEKRKIGELLKKLSNETDEKEKLKQMLSEDKKIYEERIRTLETSIQQQSMISNFNEFKAESFSQSFIADKNKATLNDIKTLRKKFDSAFETLKKVSLKNDGNSTLINNESLIEEVPIRKIPNPIKQDDFMNNLPSIPNDEINEKSFISNTDNDLINNLGNMNNSIRKNNNNNMSIKSFSTSTNTMGSIRGNKFGNNNNHGNFGSKYKEMLNRIREKSQEKAKEINEGRNLKFNSKKINNNLNNQNLINNTNNFINDYSNNYNNQNNYSFTNQNLNIFKKSNYNNCPNQNYINNNNIAMTIANDIQLEFNQDNQHMNNMSYQNNNNNNNIYFSMNTSPVKNNELSYIPQNTGVINLNTSNMSFNNNNNFNNSINDNEYVNVINLLNTNKETISSNLNNSSIDNKYNDFLSTFENKETKNSWEEKCNLNVLNYIMKLEEKEKKEKNENKEKLNEDKIIDKSKEISSQMQELEQQIENLTLEQKKYDDPTKITPEQLHNLYKKDKTKLFEDFQKINSKYI